MVVMTVLLFIQSFSLRKLGQKLVVIFLQIVMAIQKLLDQQLMVGLQTILNTLAQNLPQTVSRTISRMWPLLFPNDLTAILLVRRVANERVPKYRNMALSVIK